MVLRHVFLSALILSLCVSTITQVHAQEEDCFRTVRDGKIVKICDGVIFNKFGMRIGEEREKSDFGDVKPPFGWVVKTFFQDLRERIVFNEVDLAEVKLQHAQDNQREIEEYVKENRPIPRDFEERRLQKIEQADMLLINVEQKQPQFAQEKSGVIDKLRTAFNVAINAGELNEIRIAVSEFKELKNMKAENEVEKRVVANSIDSRINSLKIVKNNCQERIDSLKLSELDNVYDAVTKICPRLADFSSTEAEKILNDKDY